MTFTSILAACSHAGQVEDGNRFFKSMEGHGITPTIEHFNCMIDLLGRVGLLEEIEELIKNMQFQPSGTSWLILLCACRIHLDTERGKQAVKHIMDLNPLVARPYVLLSNVYAASTSVEGGVFEYDYGFEGSLNNQCG